MELPRQDPDQLLRAIRNDASTKKSGKLKIFFGYAAGVGKTYAMLQAAHQANQGNKAIGKPNCYQKVIICPSEPRRLIFDYCGAISALPGAFSLVTAVRFLNGRKSLFIDCGD